MHQPYYKDLATGEYQLPWTRMHALKDYYGMVQILDGFPQIRQTFNLVPSMMAQIDEYARGVARDPFLRAASKPAEDLLDDEREFVLRHFFQANIPRMIYRYPRYGELFDLWRTAGFNPSRARRSFGEGAIRDLQVLSQLAWFDEEFHDRDPEVRALVAKQRGYSLSDQAVMCRKQQEILAKVLPVYREFAARGQIELSITPFYHPILPLLCDTAIASASHPNVPLPSRFAYPEDARHQIVRAREYAIQHLGAQPNGLWPSEGSVSDESLALAADAGFKWMATDNGILGATLQRLAGTWETYQPYVWSRAGREMKLIFRDHFLSDLIGFVYSRMDATAAAQHFVDRIEENCLPILESGKDVLVPIILDGENAWEHYQDGGRQFLKQLYGRIESNPRMTAVTVTDALQRMQPSHLGQIFPGSWINSNFDIWIGSAEDNRAWDLLLQARQTYDRVMTGPDAKKLSQAQKDLAFEELLIAEGSDWFWWYGPEHYSENRPEFDKLFRGHLAQVHRALGLTPPPELSQPILEVPLEAAQEEPSAWIRPLIDGEVTSYFEWMGAGLYVPDRRQGAMHGSQPPVRVFHYGASDEALHLRLDLDGESAGLEVHVTIECSGGAAGFRAMLTETGAELLRSGAGKKSWIEAQCDFRKVFEASLPLTALPEPLGEAVRLQVSLWRDGLPVDAIPSQGWIALQLAEPD